MDGWEEAPHIELGRWAGRGRLLRPGNKAAAVSCERKDQLFNCLNCFDTATFIWWVVSTVWSSLHSDAPQEIINFHSAHCFNFHSAHCFNFHSAHWFNFHSARCFNFHSAQRHSVTIFAPNHYINTTGQLRATHATNKQTKPTIKQKVQLKLLEIDTGMDILIHP